MASGAKFDSIADITAAKETWTIMARVARMWHVPDYNNPHMSFSMDMVLIDDKGDKIQASIRRTLVYKFQKDLKEDCVYSISYFGVAAANGGGFRNTRHPYKLNFQFGTKVVLLDNGAMTSTIYKFSPVSEIFRSDFNRDYLVDVMGMLTVVGAEKELDRNGIPTKMKVISLEAEGVKFECTLFGSYVDELNSFLDAGHAEDVVVIILFAKVKSFQGKVVLQNTINSTRLIFNPVCSQAFQGVISWD